MSGPRKQRIDRLLVDRGLASTRERAQALILAGEVFVELGIHAKKHSPFGSTMIGGYTNGNMGYIPTRSAFDEGGYEPNSHVYLIEQQYDPGIEEVAKRGMLEVLESCAGDL